jgi:small subunit ribosomal protein S11
VPTISSLSSPQPTAERKYRWDPTPLTDETPTTHTLTITSTSNNLLLTLADRQGPVFPTITGGSGKTFKNAARSGYEASHQASLKMFEKIMEVHAEAPTRTSMKIRLAMKGFMGQGAEAFTQALAGNDGVDVRKLISRVEDRTGIKIGGTRARKARRL